MEAAEVLHGLLRPAQVQMIRYCQVAKSSRTEHLNQIGEIKVMWS
jgi:hypothetical protein